MKRVFCSLIGIAVIIGCSTEADVEIVKEKTFVRYYGTQENDVAVLALEDLNGGFALLSTSEIETGITGQIDYNIHLTRLDEWGNLLWHNTYLQEFNTTASSFIQTPDGYFVIGDRIKSNTSSDLQILHISDEDGSLIDEKTISLGSRSLHGEAIAFDGSNFIVLGSIEPRDPNNMLIAKISPTALGTPIWIREHGDGAVDLINAVYIDQSRGDNVWGGSVEFGTSLDFKVVMALENSQAPYINENIGSPNYNEFPKDFCRAFAGWVVTGYSNAVVSKTVNNITTTINSKGTEDIYVQKILDDATPRFYTQLEGVDQATDGDQRNERGNSVCYIAGERSYVVLGTVETALRKEDLMITKIDDAGAELWSERRYFGGADKQEGASVRELSDGSLLVFGTTYFGTEKKLILIKVDKNGNL
jgi:hypothetical protein